jgi:hypothetical protein
MSHTGCGNADDMSPNLEPTSNAPLFDQRNCIARSWNWLEGLLLGPRFEQVQRSDGSWIYVPRLESSDSGIQRPPLPELLIVPAGYVVSHQVRQRSSSASRCWGERQPRAECFLRRL